MCTELRFNNKPIYSNKSFMEIIQRIKLLIREKDCSVNSFAREIGISQRTLNNYILLGRLPSYETIHAILHRFTDVSAEWLMRGEGNMYVADGLPVIRGDETEHEENLHAALARCRAELEDSQNENVKLLGQLAFMEEYNLKIAAKLNKANEELEKLRGNKSKKKILFDT